MRRALGTQSPAEPGHHRPVDVPDALCHGPTLDKVYTEACKPYAAAQITFEEAVSRRVPMRQFMLKQTCQSDMALFARARPASMPRSRPSRRRCGCWCRPSSPAS